MNCNKKSHFDGVTLVHRQERGGEGGEEDLVMSLFARRRCSRRPWEKERGERKRKGKRSEK